MTDTELEREFLSGDRKWRVAPRAATPSGPPGLYFQCGNDTRFLAFTRGALSNANELRLISDEVLRVLLRRAAAE